MLMVKVVSALGLVFTATAFSACGSSAASEPAQSAQAGLTRAPLSAPTTLQGPLKIAADAFAEVPLRPDQRSELEQLLRDNETRHEALKKARGEASLAVAAQVESGTIDRAALAPKFAAIEAERAKSRPLDRAAIERAHELLTPDQRVAFVNALEAKMNANVGEHKPMAHGQHGLDQWATDLQLTDDQKAKIRENMKASFQARAPGDGHGAHGAEMHARWVQFTNAFKSDHFVLDEIAPKQEAIGMEHDAHDHILKLAEAAEPVLTADQRVLAAKKIRERSGTGEAPIVEGPIE